MELHKHPSISQLHVYTEEAGNTILKLHLQVRVMAGAHPTISSLASKGWQQPLQNCPKYRATHQSESFLLHLLTSKLISIGGKYINIHTHTHTYTYTYVYICIYVSYTYTCVYTHIYKNKRVQYQIQVFFFLTTKWRKTPKYSNESKDMLLLKLAQLHVGTADL